MTRFALEHELAPRGCGDPGHDGEWRSQPLQPRPLLDVQLQERAGSRRARFAEPPRAGTAGPAAAFLVPERHDRQRPLSSPGPRDRLQTPYNPQRAVEPAALGNRVEVRPGPDLLQLRPMRGAEWLYRAFVKT